MTKLEALAKDCIENHTHKLIDKPTKQDIYTREESIYISGYKECERQDKNKIADLERKLEQTEKDLADYQFNYPKIKDLEKENAELKRDKEDLIFIRNQNAKCMCEDKEQLNKAKEIIKKMLYEYQRLCVIKKETIAEVEQFLKE